MFSCYLRRRSLYNANSLSGPHLQPRLDLKIAPVGEPVSALAIGAVRIFLDQQVALGTGDLVGNGPPHLVLFVLVLRLHKTRMVIARLCRNSGAEAANGR